MRSVKKRTEVRHGLWQISGEKESLDGTGRAWPAGLTGPEGADGVQLGVPCGLQAELRGRRPDVRLNLATAVRQD
jgi:hypothetical protein